MSLRSWPSESSVTTDRLSGLPVRQLTNHKGHSHHLYFTNPGWWDNGRRLLFGSDRLNRTNLFSVELASGEITQVTDADMPGPPDETSFLFACVSPTRDEAYFWRGRDLVAVHLRTGSERILYRAPDGFDVNMTNCTADGRFVCSVIYESLAGAGGTVALLRGYRGFQQYFESRPLSRVLRVPVDGGPTDVVHEDRAWIGHVNTSPTQPHLLTFCHEGPWDLVQQRIWGLDLGTGRAWKIRPQEPGIHVGHEYWFADGLRIGYHGRGVKGKIYGAVRYDNTDLVEAAFPFDSQHFFSLDLDLVVGDGERGHSWDHSAATACVLLWRFRDGAFDGPRILCEHRGSAHVQQTHVHPRFSPERSYVVFTSDTSGYGNVYTVPVPAFESLPVLTR